MSAYSNSYNPDALPAHAEPEQVAAMMSAYGRRDSQASQAANRRPDRASPPQPQRPSQQPQRPSQQSGSSYGAPPAGAARPYRPQSPPSRNYGGFSPPPQSYQGRPMPNARQPTSPPHAPIPAGADASLFSMFKSVDKDGSGRLTETELRSALVNNDYSFFDQHTIRMMIRMFNMDGTGTIGYEEFCNLWGFLGSWRGLFDKFDADGSGSISYDEFSTALVAFGYRLTPQFIELIFQTYDKRGTGALSLDLFVQSCISLKRMTDVFKRYDEDRDGYITLSL
ncbi:MAG: hypothetical protein M1815_004314 [Lichina confinis]|nr:MAG: hypothetical protein M1815_004314 [Lichina confinis]